MTEESINNVSGSYEEIRNRNIARNEQFMREIGLDLSTKSIDSKENLIKPSKKMQRERKENPDFTPRKSSRLSGEVISPAIFEEVTSISNPERYKHSHTENDIIEWIEIDSSDNSASKNKFSAEV